MAATLKVDTIVHPTGTPNNLTLDNAGNVTIGNNLTVTGTTTQTGAQTFSGNVTMSGTGARFLGDFTNATVTSRVAFQTSTTNGTTGIYALPNGTSTAASWQATNAADPTNASKILIATNGSTDVQLVSGRNGTGTYLPLSFYTNGSQQMVLDTSGNLGVGTASPSQKLDVNGNIRSKSSSGGIVNMDATIAGTTNTIGSYNNNGASFADLYISTNNTLFYNAGSERARIDQYGSLLVGTTTSPTTTAGLGTISTPGTVVMGSSFKRNRIINGDMRVDQRNAGASVTQTGSTLYSVDRFAIGGSVTSKFSAQQSSVAPAGFVNSVLCTSLSAYTVGTGEFFTINQRIEGLNISDLNWGTANAKTVTLSFWVRSSLTGTFGGSLYSYSGDASYPFSYTISSANTWTAISITIAGPTIGTFPTDNSGSLVVNFSLGANSSVSGTAGSWSSTLYRSATGATSVVGTNGATFYITGVQLETGSIATPYERQIYSEQLAQCQRYYTQYAYTNGGWADLGGFAYSTTTIRITVPLVPMRTSPTLVISGNAPSFNDGAVNLVVSSPAYLGSNYGNDLSAVYNLTVTGATQYRMGNFIGLAGAGAFTFSAEL